MRPRIVRALSVTARAHRGVRLSCRLLLITGVVALGYVGMTLLDARLYQASAKRSLETQVQTLKEIGSSHSGRPSSRATFWAALIFPGWECRSRFCREPTLGLCDWAPDT